LLSLLPFLTRLNENLQRVDNRVNRYLKTPNSKQIHNVRTAIRRLDATFMLLPKNNRSHSSLSDYLVKCKEFFKVNSEIRDLDIIYEKLQEYHPNTQRNNLLESLKATRGSKLQHAKMIARSLKRIDTSKIVDKIGVTEKELAKRHSKIVSNLISTIQATFPIVITNSMKLEELHDLRIACKKLRYLLELIPDENNMMMKTRKSLQKLQDVLGAIHDYDFTIEYLNSLGQQSLEIQEIIAIEKERRNVKYDEFIRLCRRRLKISPDSFLIALRNLNHTSS
jgi:CHAD domain-containing protein